MKIEDMCATLRTFSLDYDKFSSMIDNVALLLRIMTISIYRNKTVSWIYYVITIVAALCYFYIYIFSMAYAVFVRYSVTENFVDMCVIISLTTCSITSVTKFLFMKYNISSIQKTTEKILKFDAQIVHDNRFATNLRKNLRVVKKRALFIWIFLVANGTIYIVIPFLRPGRHFTQDLYIIYGLEPMLVSPNYEIVHILTTISILYGVFVMVNVAVYVIVVVGYNEAQLYAISEEVKNLWNDSQNFYNKTKHNIRNKIYATNIKVKIVNKYIQNRLRTIVYYHASNIYLFKEMNNQLSGILAVEYCIMCVAIIAELLGGLENTYFQIPYTIVQISMDCLSGQRLMDACNELENALFFCEWENFDASNQKTILLMLLISQKTLTLSAGGMANLNFNCLMIILKSSYSAYTTLKSSIQHG